MGDKKEIMNENMVINLLYLIDGELKEIYLDQGKNPIFYLIGGGSIILDDINNSIYQQTKDVDFLWKKSPIIDTLLKDHIIYKRVNFIRTKDKIEDEENFLRVLSKPGNKTIEFLNYEFFVDNTNEYKTDLLNELMIDIDTYFINPKYNLKYIKVCNAYFAWYTRIITARLKPYNNLEYDNNLDFLRYPYIEKTLTNINSEINIGTITKQNVIDNIGYLINKYYYNNEYILNDWQLFISKLDE